MHTDWPLAPYNRIDSDSLYENMIYSAGGVNLLKPDRETENVVYLVLFGKQKLS